MLRDEFIRPDQTCLSHLHQCAFQPSLVILGLVHAVDGTHTVSDALCILVNTGAVCGQIFMRCWKKRFFRTSWTIFSWGSVISGERDGAAAARSLQWRTGRMSCCQCALNTSCVDHGALMSTLWDLFSWQCSLWTNFCFTKTFVTLSLVL